jgi:PIN domain nuclease of toxin-antitoxin system
LLLDTQAFLWWAKDAPALTKKARAAISPPAAEIYVSAASAWEITTKHRIGRLPGAASVAADVLFTILDNGFEPLAISVAHAQRAGALAGAHRDPFDRMLAAQALIDGLTVVTNDKAFAAFGVRTLW